VPGPGEVEQFFSGDHGVRGDLRAHPLTIPSRSADQHGHSAPPAHEGSGH
jgi:hypothetical protein